MSSRALVGLQWLIIITLVALLIAPYITRRAASGGAEMQMAGMPAGMMQKLFPLDHAGVPIPSVSFTLQQGAPDGWYLHIVTTNFTFTPEKINATAVAGEGHAHLYIDDKLIVILGPWYHIPADAITSGKHTISVSLNANDHSAFAIDGKPIEATQTLYAY